MSCNNIPDKVFKGDQTIFIMNSPSSEECCNTCSTFAVEHPPSSTKYFTWGMPMPPFKYPICQCFKSIDTFDESTGSVSGFLPGVPALSPGYICDSQTYICVSHVVGMPQAECASNCKAPPPSPSNGGISIFVIILIIISAILVGGIFFYFIYRKNIKKLNTSKN